MGLRLTFLSPVLRLCVIVIIPTYYTSVVRYLRDRDEYVLDANAAMAEACLKSLSFASSRMNSFAAHHRSVSAGGRRRDSASPDPYTYSMSADRHYPSNNDGSSDSSEGIMFADGVEEAYRGRSRSRKPSNSNSESRPDDPPASSSDRSNSTSLSAASGTDSPKAVTPQPEIPRSRLSSRSQSESRPVSRSQSRDSMHSPGESHMSSSARWETDSRQMRSN